MPNIDIGVRLKDEFSKEMEKIADVTKEAEISIGDMIDTVIDGQPELKAYREEFVEMFKAVEAGALPMDNAIKRMDEIEKITSKTKKVTKEAGKQNDKFTKGLKNVVKGALGVSTAFAAGKAIVGFAKNAISAADAAGRLPPELIKARKENKKFTEELGVSLARKDVFFEQTFAKITKGARSSLEVENAYADAVRRGIITGRESQQMRSVSLFGTLDLVKATRELAQREREHREELEKTTKFNRRLGDADRDIRGGIARTRQAALEGIRPPRATPGEGFGVQAGLGGEIAGQLQQLELFKLGWLDVQNNVSNVVELYKSGEKDIMGWSPHIQFVEQALRDSAVEIAQMSLEAGIFATEAQAAAALAKDLGIGPAEALALLRGMSAEITFLTSKRWQAFLDFTITTRGNIPIPQGPSGTGKVFTPLHAGGGVQAGQPVMTGELGPEPFIPSQNGTIVPSDQFNIAGLKTEIAGMRSDLKNSLLDMGQMIVESIGG